MSLQVFGLFDLLRPVSKPAGLFLSPTIANLPSGVKHGEFNSPFCLPPSVTIGLKTAETLGLVPAADIPGIVDMIHRGISVPHQAAIRPTSAE